LSTISPISAVAAVGGRTEIADEIADGYELFMCFFELQNRTAYCITIAIWGYAIGLAHCPESEFLTAMFIYYFFDPILINDM